MTVWTLVEQATDWEADGLWVTISGIDGARPGRRASWEATDGPTNYANEESRMNRLRIVGRR